MPHLHIDSEPKRLSLTSSAVNFVRRSIRRANKAILRSYKFKLIHGRDLPIRFRPWFLLFTTLLLILLGLLGFTNISNSVPVNDKVLHFICLGAATGIFYWIFDVDEDSRRIWFWRHAGLICTFVLCFLFGGIISEFVQSMLPYKTFQSEDVVANLLGSSCGLFISYYLEKYYRHRREISRLYRPLDATAEDAISEDELDTLTSSTLPLYRQTPQSLASPTQPNRMAAAGPRLANVWDSREDLFAVGDDDDEDHREAKGGASRDTSSPHNTTTP